MAVGKEIDMTKISKLILGAGALGVMGIAALPFTSYAVDSQIIVEVTQQDTPGGCVGDECSGGGNDPDGYTLTITDRDSAKFNLSSTDEDGATSGGFAPIATAASTVSGSNVYGVKFSANGGSEGFQGTFTGTLAAHDNTNYVPIQATVGTYISDGPGTFSVTHVTGESHDSSLLPGTYRNTIRQIWVGN